jgi:hypothetical protein
MPSLSFTGKIYATGQYNIKMNIKENLVEGVDCSYLTEDTVQWRSLKNTVLHLRAP